jgi:hypothetical protein
VKIGIVAHESRIQAAHQLVKDVHADYISVDRHHMLGPNRNHRHVWEHVMGISAGDEWCIVLEDDAKACNNFRDQAARVISKRPHEVEVISFYLGRMRPPQWQDRVRLAVTRATATDATWIVGNVALHAVGLAMIGDNVAKMLWATRTNPRPPDESITMWCRSYGHKVGYCFPSIVEHGDMPTLITHPDGQERESGRVAWSFGMREQWATNAIML